jgi:hypothetical protein
MLPGCTTAGTPRTWPAKKTTIFAYAEDVSILLTSQEDVRTIHGAITCYEKATGAVLNVAQSSALAVGTWDTSCDIMGTPYSEELTVLGVKLINTMKISALSS